MGAIFDSMSFDAFGNTITSRDSFILPETCYILSPTSFLKDKYDTSNIGQVQQPVICVDSIIDGESAAISVSFLDDSNVSTSSQTDTINEQFKCSELIDGQTLVLDSNKATLIHVSGIGEDGSLDFSVCPNGDNYENLDAYFHDS